MSLKDACQRIQSGDGNAFAIIVDATATQLVRLAARIMGDLSLGEDVVQEAYCKAYDALMDGQFDGRSEVQTWLYRIVTNTALDALRSRARRTLPLGNADVSNPTDQLEARAALRALDGWIADLPPDQRVAIVLKELEGQSSVAIGKTLSISEGAVEQLLVRARSTLRARRDRQHD